MTSAKNSEESLESLVKRSLEDNKETLEMLLSRCGPLVFWIFIRCGVDWHTAEDLTQEVLVTVSIKLGQWRNESLFSAWVRTIALNCLRAHLRKQSHWTESLRPDTEPTKRTSLFEFTDDHHLLIEWLSKEAGLDPKQREVILLRFGEGLSIDETAERMGIKRDTVIEQTSRARARSEKAVYESPMATLGGSASSPAHINLVSPLDAVVFPSPIVFEPLGSKDVLTYELSIEPAGGTTVRFDVATTPILGNQFSSLLGRCADLIVVAADDLRLAPLRTADSGLCTITVTAWGANDTDLGSAVRHVTMLDTRDGQEISLVEILEALEGTEDTIHRDVIILDVLDAYQVRIDAEAADCRNKVNGGARLNAIANTLACLAPLRKLYVQRLADSFSTIANRENACD